LHHGWKKTLKTFWPKFKVEIWSCGVLWIPSTINVFPLLDGGNYGGYGVVRKVWIKRLYHIPNMIELVGKTPKTNDKWRFWHAYVNIQMLSNSFPST
jgi:hypothetical protein